MGFQERDQRTDRIGERLVRNAELALHRAHVADTLRALLEDREAFATETTAQRIGRIQREPTLTLQRAFDRAAEFALRQGFQILAGETHRLDRANHAVLGRLEQVVLGFLNRIKRQARRRLGRVGGRSRFSGGHLGGGGGLTLDRSSGFGFESRSGFHLGSRSNRGGGGRGGRGHFQGVTRGLLHLLQPLRDHLGLAHRLDLVPIHLERQLDIGRMVLLHDLVVAMVIGRPEQLTGDGALVDDLEIALRRVDLDLGGVKELREVLFKNMVHRRGLALERNPVRHRNRKRRGLRRRRAGRTSFGLFVLHDGDEAVVLADDHAGDLEQLVSAARGADGLRQRGEPRVLRIKRDIEKRADVGALVARGEATFAGTAETLTTTLAAAAVVAAGSAATGSITTRTAGLITTLATFTGSGRRSRRSVAARSGSRRTALYGAGRFAETAAVARRTGGIAFAARAVITTRTVVPTRFTRASGVAACGVGFVLGPLRAEAEALELGQIDFVKIFGRFIVGRRLGHSERMRAYMPA